MPDFKAISDLLGAAKNAIDGVTGIFGSLYGDAGSTALEAAIGSLD